MTDRIGVIRECAEKLKVEETRKYIEYESKYQHNDPRHLDPDRFCNYSGSNFLFKLLEEGQNKPGTECPCCGGVNIKSHKHDYGECQDCDARI